MSHPTHRDRIQLAQFKRAHEVLDDEDASRIEELLAAEQKRELERTPYREATGDTEKRT